MMKTILHMIVIGCVLVAATCIIISYFMFNIKASAIVFAAVMAVIGVFEGLRSIDDIEYRDMEGDDENDDI